MSQRTRLRFPAGGDPHRSPLIYRCGWQLTRWISGAWFRGRYTGAENIPTEGGFILAANHASFIDPPLIGAGCPRPLSYLARESLFANPMFGWVLRRVGSVPVDRDGASGKGLKTILDRLRGGDGVLLFPEGTRSRDGGLQPGRAGIGLVVLKSGAPVVPTRVFGTFEAYGRDQRVPRAGRVSVRYGRVMELADLRARAADAPRPQLKELYGQVANRIMEAIAALGPP